MPDPQSPLPTGHTQASWEDYARYEAKRQGVAPQLAIAVLNTESAGDRTAVSKAGALGPMQLMPETAKRLGVDANDPLQNIRGGVTELKRLLDENAGDVTSALRLYNGSPQAPAAATDPYVAKVYERMGLTSPAGPAGRRQTQSTGPGAHKVSATPPAPGVPPPTPLPQYGSKESLAAQPPPSPTQFEGPSSRLEEAAALGKSAISGLDPRTSAGRKALAATIAVPAAAIYSGGISLPASAAVAGTAAGLETAVENAITGSTESPTTEALTQGGLELAGGAALWPIQAVGRRMLAHPVAKAAAAKLASTREAVMSTLDTALEAAKTSARGTKTAAAQATRGAVASAAAGKAAAKGQAENLAEAAAAPYEAALAAPPPIHEAGVRAAQTLRGPAKSALGEIGQGVEEAAASGPDVPTQPLKDALAEARAQLQIPSKGEVSEADLVATETKRLVGEGWSPQAAASAAQQRVAQGGAELPAEHPLRGALGQIDAILNDAGDTLPFSDVHKIKRVLDEAVNWDRPAKKQAEQLTKSLRNTVRDELGVHAPYNQATAAYAATRPLLNEGFAKSLRRQATAEPSAFISRISTKTPNQTAMIRDALTTLPAGQGPAAAREGQQAWQAVQSAWTYDKVIKGGIDKLGERLDALTPEFLDAFAPDRASRQVFDNLRKIHADYTKAVDDGRILVEGATAKGKAAVEATRRAGEAARDAEAAALQALRSQRRGALKPTGEEIAFKESSIFPDIKGRAVDEHVADVLRAIALGPHTFWGAYSIGRLMRGPASEDLVKWAAYGGGGRVKALTSLMTSRAPGMAAADLLRLLEADGMIRPRPGEANEPPPGPDLSAPAEAPAMRQILAPPPPPPR